MTFANAMRMSQNAVSVVMTRKTNAPINPY